MAKVITSRRVMVLALLLALLLSACGTDDMVKNAYTASGDGTDPDSVNETKVFHPQDDLNVVIELNTHRRELELYAVFNGPDGSQIATNTLDADETVPWVLLGLDWEASGGTDWVMGEWTVDVYVDEERQESLTFEVKTDTNGSDTNSAG